MATVECSSVYLPRGERGVALAVLLWFLAALALLVSSLALTAKTDIKHTRNYIERVQVEALATAGAQLLMTTPVGEEQTLYQRSYKVGDSIVLVRAVPAQGLISFRDAGVDVLEALFEHGAGTPPDQAASLANSVIEWRTEQKQARRDQSMAVSPPVAEDILSVDGVTRELYDSIRPLMREGTGSSTVDVNVAPAEVLKVLASGDPDRVAIWLDSRAEDQGPGALLQPSNMRIDSRVKMPSGTVYERSVWVDSGSSSTGWKVVRSFQPQVVGALTFGGEEHEK